MNKIEAFKQTIDYRVISYFVDSIRSISIRLSILEELGYNIGIQVVQETPIEIKKDIIRGKNGKLRMLVTNRIKTTNYAKCIIIENKPKKSTNRRKRK